MTNQNTLADLSSTAALNLNIKGQSQQGTAPASTIDSIFQKYGASLHDFYNSLGGVATVSGTDTYTVTITEDWAALASGLILAIKVPNANTGAATLNVTVPTAGALGAKAIRRQGDSALSANDMVANGVYLLRYSTSYNSAAGAWVLLNPASSSVSLPITEANGGTNQTTYTQGDLLYASTSNTLAKLAKGTTGQVLSQTSTIPAWGGAITLGSPTASTSGTSIDFTGIPSGVRHVRVIFNGVSTNGSSNYLIQIGSGSVTSSGYVSGAVAVQGSASSSAAATSTAGFVAAANMSSSMLTSGCIDLFLENSASNKWVARVLLVATGGTRSQNGSGSVTLAGVIDRVRITAVNGTDAFNAGEINISYEF